MSEEMLRGARLFDRGDYVAAEACFKGILDSNPSGPESGVALHNLGMIEAKKGNLDKAIEITEQAIHSDSTNIRALAHCNTGNLLIRTGRLERAKEEFDRAQALGLNNWTLHINKAVLGIVSSDPEMALDSAHSTLVDAPQEKLPEVINILGHAYLMKGDLVRGLQLVADHWSILPPQVAALNLPVHDCRMKWKGERVLLYHNHGLGDTIMFSRWLPQLRREIEDSGGLVVLALPSCLITLFDQLEVSDGIQIRDIAFADTWEGEFDTSLSIALLPLQLRINKDEVQTQTQIQSAYMSIADFNQVTPSQGKLKIGVIWGARQDKGTGPRRTIPIESFALISDIREIQLYSLQVGPQASDVMGIQGIKDLSSHINDFLDLAHLMQEMDLIISADTGPLHLAGALGIDTISILSRNASDWRWGPYPSEKNLWYNTVKLIRQEKVGDWNTPMLSVRQEILSRLQVRF